MGFERHELEISSPWRSSRTRARRRIRSRMCHRLDLPNTGWRCPWSLFRRRTRSGDASGSGACFRSSRAICRPDARRWPAAGRAQRRSAR